LMVIPVVAAMRVGRSFKQSFVYSILFAVLAVFFGLLGAFYFNLPAGGAIVLVALLIFAVASVVGRK